MCIPWGLVACVRELADPNLTEVYDNLQGPMSYSDFESRVSEKIVLAPIPAAGVALGG